MRGNKLQQVRTGAAVAAALLVGGLVAACTPPSEPIVTFPPASGQSVVTDAPNELRGPLTGVAATLSKSKGNAAGATATAFESDDLKKVRRRTHAHRTPSPRSPTR